MPELSIIVTTYNVEPYVEQCLRSVAEQTLTDLEIIVVDDGSTDGTPEIIRSFAEQDARVVPVLLGTNSPGGVATAANAGLDVATSEWIGFLDGDDYAAPTMFASLREAASGYDADLAMCQYEEVDDTGATKAPADHHRWSDLDRTVYPLDFEARQRFLRFVAVPWRKLYRRSVLEERGLRFPVGDYFYEDNPFHWFALLSAESIALVPRVLCWHRVARVGQTTSAADERLFKIFAHHDTIRDFLDREGVTSLYATTLLGWVISQLEWIGRRTPKELRRQLYDAVAPILSGYPMPVIMQALRENNKGATAERLSTALAKQNLPLFLRTLDGRAAKAGVVTTGLHHLRYSGIRTTAAITRRYLRNRLEAGGVRGGERNRTKIDNADLMFALVVLQKRLDSLEVELAALRSELADRPDSSDQ